jgi:hypothetical protein
MNFRALVFTVAIIFVGILICTRIAESENGKTLLNLINIISFVLGAIHMYRGGREGNIMRLIGGLIVIIGSIGSLGIPEPYDSGVALFLGIGGFFVRFP